jgi:hypothetical protein
MEHRARLPDSGCWILEIGDQLTVISKLTEQRHREDWSRVPGKPEKGRGSFNPFDRHKGPAKELRVDRR